jgi:hypothetical protein
VLSVGTLVVGVVACHLGAHGGGCSVPSYGTGRWRMSAKMFQGVGGGGGGGGGIKGAP